MEPLQQVVECVAGKMPECEIEIDGEFEFLHPKTVCFLVKCSHFAICSCYEKPVILPIAKYGFDVEEYKLPGNGVNYDDCGEWRYRGLSLIHI